MSNKVEEVDFCHVTSSGRFYFMYSLFNCAVQFMSGVTTVILVFLTNKEKRFAACNPGVNGYDSNCAIPLLLAPHNCSKDYFYPLTTSSIVSYWDLSDCASNISLNPIGRHLHEAAVANSFYFFGCLIGVSGFGLLADRFGRRPMITISLIILQIGATMCAFSSNLYVFCLCRAISGLGVSGLGLITFILISEISHSSHRPFVAALTSFSFCLGACYICLMAFYLDSWRQLLVSSIVPGFLLLFVLLTRLNIESPRYYCVNGLVDKAVDTLMSISQINGDNFSRSEILDLIKIDLITARSDNSNKRYITTPEVRTNEDSIEESDVVVDEVLIVDTTPLSCKPVVEASPDSPQCDEISVMCMYGTPNDTSLETLGLAIKTQPMRQWYGATFLLWLVISFVYYGLLLDNGSLAQFSFRSKSEVITIKPADNVHSVMSINDGATGITSDMAMYYDRLLGTRPYNQPGIISASAQNDEVSQVGTMVDISTQPDVLIKAVRKLHLLDKQKFVLATLVSFIIELPSSFLSSYAAKKVSIGRLGVIINGLVVGGLLCLTGFVMQYVSVLARGVIWFANLGRLFFGCSFLILYLYSGELFPTTVRTSAVGTLSFAARMSGIFTPLIVSWLDDAIRGLPLLIFGLTALLTAYISNNFLPETNNKPLYDTISAVMTSYAQNGFSIDKHFCHRVFSCFRGKQIHRGIPTRHTNIDPRSGIRSRAAYQFILSEVTSEENIMETPTRNPHQHWHRSVHDDDTVAEQQL